MSWSNFADLPANSTDWQFSAPVTGTLFRVKDTIPTGIYVRALIAQSSGVPRELFGVQRLYLGDEFPRLIELPPPIAFGSSRAIAIKLSTYTTSAAWRIYLDVWTGPTSSQLDRIEQKIDLL